jgi:putative FmdB family regulatory protein
MALYEYECEACGQRFELIRKFSESEVEICTLCGKGPVKRLFSSPAIQFKGSGFYITDYAQKGRPEGGSPKPKGDKPATSDAGSGETASSDTPKSDAKGDSKGGTAAKPESSSPAKGSGPAKD